VRADAKAGVVTVQSAALSTAALIVEGNGEIDLGQEALALRLRPRAKISGTGVVVPVKIGGHLAAPSAKVDLSTSGNGGLGFSGLLLGVKDVMGAAGGGDPCPAALARARESAGAPEEPK